MNNFPFPQESRSTDENTSRLDHVHSSCVSPIIQNEKSFTSAKDDIISSSTRVERVESETNKSPSQSIRDVLNDEGDFERPENDAHYPEGGFQAWLVTFGAWCSMFVGLGMVNIVGTLQAFVATHQLRDYPESSVSWIFSVYVFIVFFCGLQIGPIFDAKGPRVLIFIGSVLAVTSMMLLSLCTAYWHFMIVFGIMAGLGSSLLFTPAVASIAHFFMAKRSTATGLAATGGSTGGVVFPLVLRALLPKVGWAWATRCLGFIFLVFVIVANLLVRSRLPRKKNTVFADVLPDFRIFLDGTGAMALVTAGTFFMEFGLFVPITYLTSFCLSRGVDTDFSYQIMAILNAGSCFGRWVPGLGADLWGRYNVMILTLLLCLVTTVVFWLPTDMYNQGIVPLLVVYAVLFGFASGSNVSLVPTCVGQLCETSHYGRYYATCYTVVSFSTLTGIPIAGALIQACNGKYWGLMAFTALSYLASLICFIWIRVLKCGWKLTAVW